MSPENKVATESQQHGDEDEELEMLRLEALKAKRSLSKTFGSTDSSFELEDNKRSAPRRFRYDRESDADDEDDENEFCFEEDGVDARVSNDEASPERELHPAESAATAGSNDFQAKQPLEPCNEQKADNDKTSNSCYQSNHNYTNQQASSSSGYRSLYSNVGLQRAGCFSSNPERNFSSSSNDASSNNPDLRNLLTHRRSQTSQFYQNRSNYQPAYDRRLSDNESTRRLNKSPSPAELSYSEPITKPIEVTEYLLPRSRFQKFHGHPNHYYGDTNGFKRANFNDRPARREVRSPNDKSNSSSEKYGRHDRPSRDRNERERSHSSERRPKTRKYNSSRSSDDDSGSDRSPSRSRKKLRSAVFVPKSTNEGKTS